MLKLLNNILGVSTESRSQDRISNLRQNFIRHEAKIGGQVFGEVPKGRKRDFFCLDEHTWVWHEEWTDINGRRQVVSTRYNVRPNEVVKSLNGGPYQKISSEELHRLRQATEIYSDRVQKEIYSFV